MSLASGTRLGPYEISGKLGAGGMGEVYRARDTKLNRDVAIKVLPAAFAQNADGVARFRREAQMLASLNHPNIAAIYGLEETNGNMALALELVEGEDLAERLKRGPIPIDETLSIAKQIAEGLEAAHEKGIIHRDLKPANIKLTKNGITKILDFGLAKAFEGDIVSLDSSRSQSPTIAGHMTEAGIILGTAAYMSPEQARGKPVDKRTDIWAFGAVLFEMLTGRRLFDGETVSDMLAAVLTRDPDLTALPASTSPGVRRVLQRCLNRDPKKRLHDIADVYPDLDEVSEAAPAEKAVPRSNSLLRILPWAVAAAAIMVSGWMLMSHPNINKTSPEAEYLDLSYPANIEPFAGLVGGFSISPDGKSLAMIGIGDGARKLYIRRIDRAEPTEISEAAGINCAFFSPDSKSVAYVTSTLITLLSLADHQRTVVASDTDNATALAWSSRGILFSRNGALWIVPQQGRSPRQLTFLDVARHEVLHTDPLVLPGDEIALFSSLTTEFGTERIEAVSLQTGKRWVVLERAITPMWSHTGHLLFGRDGAILAVALDSKTAKTRGTAITVIPSGVVGTVRTGSMGFQISSNGTLVFIPVDFVTKNLISVGRDGSDLTLNLPLNSYFNPRISPDGRRMLIEYKNTIDMVDLLRGTRSKLTASAVGTSFPVWTSNGEGVVFRRFNVPFWASADGRGKVSAIPEGLLNDFPSSPGPDSDSFIEGRIQPKTSSDVYLLSISGKFPPKPLVATPAYEGGGQLAPNGKWLLYQSNESGQPEIYVRRYPSLDRAWQVSEGVGLQPCWSRQNQEIYYRNGHQMMAVAFDGSGEEPTFGKPTALFDDEYDFGQGLSIANYDVTQDGRFIMFRRTVHGNSLRVVLNWTEDLKKILAAGGTR